MQTARAKAESNGRKAKLANSYHELLEEFAAKDLRSVGNYALGRLIGKGSFGRVYLATHKLTNGSKVVLKSANKDDSNLAREIHHHRQFLHPHIARLYEVIVTESLVWLVLEYCPGDELYNYLLKHGSLPLVKVQKIFAQLVGAVCHVHNLSCVHRDLKLENILLDKNENVKLCDFGFTREYEGKASYLQTFCGTVCYSAPEMLKGEKYAGEKVDVWSLGVILYALLCGELPFDEDDDNATRSKILSGDPKWPEHMTDDARSLISGMLSKRPLMRPCLADILNHPFLAEHAPEQQAILQIQQPAPFTTPLEKETLQRMRSAGVDIDQVIENVLAKRCDALAGWWALLIEKEERKAVRRERKRKERDKDRRNSRRFSGTSSRVDRLSRTIFEVDENGVVKSDSISSNPRGRKERRSAHYPELVLTDLPKLPEDTALVSPVTDRPPPIDKDSVHSKSPSRRRPVPPPKESLLQNTRRRGSTLHLVTSNHDLLTKTPINPPKRRHQLAFIQHLAHWKHWLLDTTRRGKSPNKNKAVVSTPNLITKASNGSVSGSTAAQPRPRTSRSPVKAIRPGVDRAGSFYPPPPTRTYSASKSTRNSMSPAPLTPRSSFRRPSGLRGRKSTSSSVSSIRSIHHHHHSHSKASSTSSNGSDAVSKINLVPRSPHHSVKVLPATPTTGKFPAGVRVVRQPPVSAAGGPWGENLSSHGNAREASPAGLVFAKRKRNLFKGPMLSVTSAPSTDPFGSALDGTRRKSSGKGHTHSRSASLAGRRSGELNIVGEEDEDEEGVEEVEQFSPIESGPESVMFGPALGAAESNAGLASASGGVRELHVADEVDEEDDAVPELGTGIRARDKGASAGPSSV